MQQVQQPLASPGDLLQDEQGVWANMKKLMDYVVGEGQLSLSEASAFQCGFAQIRDPGARWASGFVSIASGLGVACALAGAS